jgi:serine/threonine protein kinase
MSAEFQRVKEIFLAAVERADPAEREECLRRACGTDAALRRQVEVLLDKHADAGSFLENPPLEPPTSDASVSERPGAVIGPYKLLEQIGEGGFGVVFMAEQTRPMRRKVALKVLKPGMDTKQVVARFEAERQALALMEHPNIARVLDAGETASGRPYFVMELVRGYPVTQFCDENNLSIPERLRLFMAVCQAVQHAHQKGIIHRDLKPSNILVTLHDGVPVVKVIDFGIAKALGQQLTDKTLFTNFAQFVGTPLYMSPEQAEMSGIDVDTRSDIYSLAVLLYELLTGTTPFDRDRLRTAAYDEIRRIIREEEPARPSKRLSTLGPTLTLVSARRKSDPQRLSRLCRGELDWIVMKALEKDRNRRYETAGAFAADVQRYLHSEPVLACPPSATYKFRKYARKHRKAFAAVAGLVALLVAGATVSVWQAVRAVRERDRADENFRLAHDAVDRYFTKVSESPALQDLRDLRKDLLLQTREFYERFVRAQPEQVALQADLARACGNLAEIYRLEGRPQESESSFRRAADLYEKLVREFPEEEAYRFPLVTQYQGLSSLYQDTGHPEKAEQPLLSAAAIAEKLAKLHPDNVDYIILLASSYSRRARWENNRGNAAGILAWDEKGIDTLRPILVQQPRHPKARREYLDLSIGRAVALAQLGHYARAARDAEEIAAQDDLTRVDVYNVACVYSRCAEAAGKDAARTPAARADLREQCASRAVATLRQAVTKGFKNVPALQTDLDLNALRGREDFQGLLREVAGKK